MKLKRVLSLGVVLFAGIGSLGGSATANSPAATLQDGQVKPSSASTGSNEPPRKSESAIDARALNRVSPDYPGPAKKAKVQGDVVVEVIVDRQGHVESARPLTGPPLLQQAATEAAWQWTFKPTLIDGVPVRVAGSITFRFNLGGRTNSGSEAADSNEPPRKSEGTIEARALNQVPADYPKFAREAKVQGDVVVEVTIDGQGYVESARPLTGPPLLRQAATDAARQWTFKPTLSDGIPVRVTKSVTFRFNLGGLPDPGPKVSGSKLANEIEQFLTGRTRAVPDFVSDDKAFVMVVADRLSPAFINQLKSLGFEITQTDEQWATVTGSVPLARLRELAVEKEVRFIAPHRKGR